MIVLYILGGLLGLLLLYVLFMSICCYVFVSTKKEYEQDSAFFRFLLHSTDAFALAVARVRVHATGVEKIPQGQKMLFVGNHRSNFDPMVAWSVLKPWKLSFISKPSNFKIPLYGQIVRRCCCMSIDRENPRNAIVTINKAANLLKKQEVSIAVYPEGTRSKQCVLLPFHNGVFKIAQKAEVPMVVLCVTGTENISKRAPFKTTDVYLDVLEVFPSEKLKGMKTDAIGEEVRQLLENNIRKREEQWQKDM